MKRLQEYLKKDYRVKAQRKGLAGCYECLDLMAATYAASRILNKRRVMLKKEYMFLVMAVISFALSFIFKGYFLQFLAASVVLAIKWIVESKTTRMLITIQEAYKKDSIKDFGRISSNVKEYERR